MWLWRLFTFYSKQNNFVHTFKTLLFIIYIVFNLTPNPRPFSQHHDAILREYLIT